MNLFSWARSITSRTSKREIGFPESWIPMTGGYPSVNQSHLLEANKEWVFVAVDKVASSMAGVRFKAMRYSRAGDDQEVFTGPLVDFLESPAQNFTGKDFIYLNAVYKELTGNAFWERLHGGRKLSPLVPTRVTPVLSNGQLVGYRYTNGSDQRTIKLKDLLHDRYIDPAKPYWGKGKLERIAPWVDASAFATELLNRFFVNGATFGGFIETEEESEERIKLIKAGISNDHVGVAKAHKIAVLPKGSKFTKGVANMAEMEMGATDDRYRDKILAAFGVPKTLVGLTTEVNRASAEASEYIYAKYTLKPIADQFLEFLNANVAGLLDPTGKQYFAYDDFVPDNMELKIKERESSLNKQPYKTVNEVRAEVGLPPAQGGDVVYGTPGQAPLGEPQPAAVPATAPEDDNADEEPKKALPARARSAFRRERIFDGIVQKVAEIAETQDLDAEDHRAFVDRVDARKGSLEETVRQFNAIQEKEVLERVQRITKAVDQNELFDMTGDVALLVDFVSPILKDLMLEQAAADFIGQEFPGTFDQAKPRIALTIETAAKRLATSYNSTTAKLIAKQLNEGIEKGEDLRQLTQRVNSVYDYSNTVRAETVAHTEAFYIANEGSREAYRQSGVVKTMRWYTAEDERVCPFCGPEDGRIIGVDDVFYEKGTTLSVDGKTLDLDYRTIDVPPLHARCRCRILPEEIAIN